MSPHSGVPGKTFFVIVEYYSRYFETVIVKTVTSAMVIRVLERIFGRLCLPSSLRSDNASPFVSDGLQNFLRCNSVERRRITPVEPWQNGKCERQNCTLMKAIRIAHWEKGSEEWANQLSHSSQPQIDPTFLNRRIAVLWDVGMWDANKTTRLMLRACSWWGDSWRRRGKQAQGKDIRRYKTPRSRIFCVSTVSVNTSY